MTQTTLPHRSDVPIEETWNLESIFPTIDAWQAACDEVEAGLPELEKYVGRLGESPATLLEYFSIADDLIRLAVKVMVYAGLAQATDVSDQQAAARMGQGRGLITRAVAARSFENPELMEIGFDTLRAWMDENPELEIYRHHFDDLERQSAHVRSAEVEEVLALATGPLPPRQTFMPYSSLINFELKFKPAVSSEGTELEVGQSSIGSLNTHKDRRVRQTAFENYADAYLDFRNTIAGTQTMAFERDHFNARARRFNSTLEASLNPSNIPLEVFHNLIRVFRENLPTWHKYWRVKRRALGLDGFGVYDIKAPLTESTVEVPYDQAVEWICSGMAPLGEEYVRVLRGGCTTDRWVDRSRNKGKRQGAFSWGSYDTQPFIMMSYADDVFSTVLRTIAHVECPLDCLIGMGGRTGALGITAMIRINVDQILVHAILVRVGRITVTDPSVSLLADYAIAIQVKSAGSFFVARHTGGSDPSIRSIPRKGSTQGNEDQQSLHTCIVPRCLRRWKARPVHPALIGCHLSERRIYSLADGRVFVFAEADDSGKSSRMVQSRKGFYRSNAHCRSFVLKQREEFVQGTLVRLARTQELLLAQVVANAFD